MFTQSVQIGVVGERCAQSEVLRLKDDTCS